MLIHKLFYSRILPNHKSCDHNPHSCLHPNFERFTNVLCLHLCSGFPNLDGSQCLGWQKGPMPLNFAPQVTVGIGGPGRAHYPSWQWTPMHSNSNFSKALRNRLCFELWAWFCGHNIVLNFKEQDMSSKLFYFFHFSTRKR